MRRPWREQKGRQGFRWAPLVIGLMLTGGARAEPLQIVALGDSNTAGFGVGRGNAFPALMETSLRADGFDVVVVNRGISGDTTAGMLARLDADLPPDTRIVIVQGGYNDRRRGVAEQGTEANIAAILARLKARSVRVVLCDLAGARWSGIARRNGAMLVPGATCYDDQNRGFDGLHMNARGHQVIAMRLTPVVRRLLGRR